MDAKTSFISDIIEKIKNDSKKAIDVQWRINCDLYSFNND